MNCTEPPEMETPAAAAKTVIHLPLGLLGFETIKEYVVLARPEEAPFLWLGMLESPGPAFLVVPATTFQNYRPDISREDAAFLKLTSPTDALALNIVTLHADQTATVNLKGPIVLHRKSLIGKQIVPVNAAQLSVRHPLPLAK